MGWGGFGSNGSVHWKIVHTGEEKHGGFVRGRDPNITSEHSNYSRADAHVAAAEYVVTLRFSGGVQQARAALSRALETVHDDKGYGIAEVHVPGVERPKEPADDYEIVVKW